MKPVLVSEGIWRLAVNDWDRRVFDALIPIPEGTSYNAYVVRGTEKTVLLDTADPAFRTAFFAGLAEFPRIDYVVAHHAEQDHSGCLAEVLERHPEATLLCTPKGRGMLGDLMALPADRIRTVEDGATLNIGGRALRFVHVPWVHWPETMATLVEPDGVLISCDFFGSHLATSSLWAEDDDRTLGAARLYYAQIMMPYANVVRKDLEKVRALSPSIIAPSHGPVHRAPARIIDAYDRWLNGEPRNCVVMPRVSMHGSTLAMAEHLTDALVARGVEVLPYDLTALPLDRFASALVDAGTVVFAAPAIWNAPHPMAVVGMYVTAGLKPKARHAALIGSYGWGAKALEGLADLLPGLKIEVLPPVTARGHPTAATFAALDALADAIASRHRAAGWLKDAPAT